MGRPRRTLQATDGLMIVPRPNVRAHEAWWWLLSMVAPWSTRANQRHAAGYHLRWQYQATAAEMGWTVEPPK